MVPPWRLDLIRYVPAGHRRAATAERRPIEGREPSSTTSILWTDPTGTVEVGTWEFCGELTSDKATGFDEVMVVLDGDLRIQTDDDACSVSRGEVLVVEAPVAASSYKSEGMLGIFLLRRRA
jgi:uncharacterized cupin superfamily protein